MRSRTAALAPLDATRTLTDSRADDAASAAPATLPYGRARWILMP
jgi:hypothetical protein